MSGTRWTAAEIDYLRGEYPRKTARQIAAHLGRSKAAVTLQAMALGLCKNRIRRGTWRCEMADWLPVQLAAGKLDYEIAELWNAQGRWKVDRRTIGYYREQLGLAVTPEVVRRRLESRRAAYRRQMERLGCQACSDLYARHVRRLAIASGWPIDCSLLEVRVLDQLSDGRPRTRREMTEALGRRTLHTSSGTGSVLANLMRRGLVLRSRGRPVFGRGKWRSCCYYYLSSSAATYHARCTRRRWVG